jgi:luciferase family oxidoreductase group 1
MVAMSVLDLVPVAEGSGPGDALRNSLDLAGRAEAAGYVRYWIAEHHNMPGLTGAATAVVIGHIAAGTRSIRVGAGGIMLPNHAPLVVAEQFGTLASLFPGRIDLGLGRAPGTDRATMLALRRDLAGSDDFPREVLELRSYFEPEAAEREVRAIPGAGLEVPLWILGSSLYGARLAAMLGLPYAFAAHFAPDDLFGALELYRAGFRPSQQARRSYAMACVNAVVAETDAEAHRLFTTLQQRFVDMIRGKRGPMKPPLDDIESYWSPVEKAQASRMLACSFVGSPDTVRERITDFIARTGVDELMISSNVFDHQARARSYELLAEAVRTPAAGETRGRPRSDAA